jgi:hypothetical protein
MKRKLDRIISIATLIAALTASGSEEACAGVIAEGSGRRCPAAAS